MKHFLHALPSTDHLFHLQKSYAINPSIFHIRTGKFPQIRSLITANVQYDRLMITNKSLCLSPSIAPIDPDQYYSMNLFKYVTILTTQLTYHA